MTNPTNSPWPWTKDWRLFSEELSRRLEQFRQQMAASWDDLRSQLAKLEESSRDAASEELQAGKLCSIQSCYGASTENLLIEPLRTRLKARNQQRALAAIGDLNTAAESLATRLPATIRISGSGLVLALQPEGRSLRSYWTSLHSTVEPLHLRQVTADRLLAEEEARSKLDGQFQLLGLERDAEELFFEALYEHAEGIFRSAFELWQRHIERIEGGVVHLRQPVNPEFDRLISFFVPADHLTLQALLQHGGLTAEELAEVFSEAEFAGHSRLERLAGLGLVEPDPRGPGFRVRPEAGRLVREALHRQNL